MANAWNGLIRVNKEAGYTSNDVVAKLRGILRQKKIGHTGTLDPDAVGLLIVCLGSATKAVELLSGHDKEYMAVVKLGVVTDTQDMTGKILKESDFSGVTHDRLNEALQAFKGGYEQTPPMYSAIKVNGERLYKLAREGKTVERAARKIRIDAISIADDSMLLSDGVFTMSVRCSKGTYIRTLCHDIGERLGCGAAMAQLVRTSVGSFKLEDALTLKQIEELRDAGTLSEHILKVEDIFSDIDRLELDTGDAELKRRLENGNSFQAEAVLPEVDESEKKNQDDRRFKDGDEFRVFLDGTFFGIYKHSAPTRQFRVEKFFYEPSEG